MEVPDMRIPADLAHGDAAAVLELDDGLSVGAGFVGDVGRAFGEFKRATSDLKESLEIDTDLNDVSKPFDELADDIKDSLDSPGDQTASEPSKSDFPKDDDEKGTSKTDEFDSIGVEDTETETDKDTDTDTDMDPVAGTDSESAMETDEPSEPIEGTDRDDRVG